ncbi:MAG: hypothetical protein Q7T41_04280 [Candidatus Saccharibacteria bacterium]|nr:hypothetical protein [Candidatus Saccharibacteria bacterium]
MSIIAISMMIIGYIPYLRDTIKGKTKPHVFSWTIGMLIAFIAFGLQIQEKSGPASFVTLSAAIVSSVIVYFAFKNPDKDITTIDYVCLFLSLASLVAWLLVKQPILSMIFVILTELISFIPTIRKSWNKPHTETLSSYAINFFRFIVALFALSKYTFVAIGYPLTWLILNGSFALMLIYRRKSLLATHNH